MIFRFVCPSDDPAIVGVAPVVRVEVDFQEGVFPDVARAFKDGRRPILCPVCFRPMRPEFVTAGEMLARGS
jgi:hypothetical protein